MHPGQCVYQWAQCVGGYMTELQSVALGTACWQPNIHEPGSIIASNQDVCIQSSASPSPFSVAGPCAGVPDGLVCADSSGNRAGVNCATHYMFCLRGQAVGLQAVPAETACYAGNATAGPTLMRSEWCAGPLAATPSATPAANDACHDQLGDMICSSSSGAVAYGTCTSNYRVCTYGRANVVQGVAAGTACYLNSSSTRAVIVSTAADVCYGSGVYTGTGITQPGNSGGSGSGSGSGSSGGPSDCVGRNNVMMCTGSSGAASFGTCTSTYKWCINGVDMYPMNTAAGQSCFQTGPDSTPLFVLASGSQCRGSASNSSSGGSSNGGSSTLADVCATRSDGIVCTNGVGTPAPGTCAHNFAWCVGGSRLPVQNVSAGTTCYQPSSSSEPQFLNEWEVQSCGVAIPGSGSGTGSSSSSQQPAGVPSNAVYTGFGNGTTCDGGIRCDGECGFFFTQCVAGWTWRSPVAAGTRCRTWTDPYGVTSGFLTWFDDPQCTDRAHLCDANETSTRCYQVANGVGAAAPASVCTMQFYGCWQGVALAAQDVSAGTSCLNGELVQENDDRCYATTTAGSGGTAATGVTRGAGGFSVGFNMSIAASQDSVSANGISAADLAGIRIALCNAVRANLGQAQVVLLAQQHNTTIDATLSIGFNASNATLANISVDCRDVFVTLPYSYGGSAAGGNGAPELISTGGQRRRVLRVVEDSASAASKSVVSAHVAKSASRQLQWWTAAGLDSSGNPITPYTPPGPVPDSTIPVTSASQASSGLGGTAGQLIPVSFSLITPNQAVAQAVGAAVVLALTPDPLTGLSPLTTQLAASAPLGSFGSSVPQPATSLDNLITIAYIPTPTPAPAPEVNNTSVTLGIIAGALLAAALITLGFVMSVRYSRLARRMKLTGNGKNQPLELTNGGGGASEGGHPSKWQQMASTMGPHARGEVGRSDRDRNATPVPRRVSMAPVGTSVMQMSMPRSSSFAKQHRQSMVNASSRRSSAASNMTTNFGS